MHKHRLVAHPACPPPLPRRPRAARGLCRLFPPRANRRPPPRFSSNSSSKAPFFVLLRCQYSASQHNMQRHFFTNAVANLQIKWDDMNREVHPPMAKVTPPGSAGIRFMSSSSQISLAVKQPSGAPLHKRAVNRFLLPNNIIMLVQLQSKGIAYRLQKGNRTVSSSIQYTL